MLRVKVGCSLREYARRAGISLQYVQKLLARGKITPLPDGSIDAAACDLQRSRNTVSGRGQRRLRRAEHQGEPKGGNSFPDCCGCGESYSRLDSRAPDPLRFCTPACESDAAAGLTRPQIRRKIARESRAVSV
jgi:hypothetical protein